MYVSHIFTLHMDPKTMKKKGLIKGRFPISGHFGRFWSPKSDLSVGQAGATIAEEMITVLTRYRPIVFELICSRNDCNFPRRPLF